MHLIQAHLADWLDLEGLPLGTSLDVVDADLSTMSAGADKLIPIAGVAATYNPREVHS